MFKKITIFTFLITLLLLIAACGSNNAKGETKDLFTIDENYNMTVSILFDKEQPTVSFTAPDNSVIDGSSLRSDSGDDWIQYYIPNASPGTWKITYDKLSNTEPDIRYSSYIDTISISDLTFSEINGEYLPVNFTVTSLSENDYNYEVYAVLINDDGSENSTQLLIDGFANMNKEISIDVYIGDLADYNNYKLQLDVWQKKGVEETYDYKMSDKSFTM